MTQRPTPTGVSAWLLVSLGLTVALLMRLPGVIVVVAPTLLLLVVDATRARVTDVQVAARVGAHRVMVGDRLPLILEFTADLPTTRGVDITTGHELVPDLGPHGLRVRLDAGTTHLQVDVIARRWGVAHIQDVVITWTSPFRTMTATSHHAVVDGDVRVLPRPEHLQSLRPRQTSGWAGLQTATHTGRGTEFAELRPFAPGDRPRDVHWPTTLRRSEPWVTARHPDRGGVVVLALDQFDPVLLPFVIRAALHLVTAHHQARDRIGVVGLGGVVSWVLPGGGERHRAALVDQIIQSQFIPTWITRSVDHLPPRALPPGALVVAISSLGHQMVTLVTQLRARDHDVVVLDLERPTSVFDPGTADHVAARLLRLEQTTRRRELTRLGVTVVGHDVLEPIEMALATARRLRQTGRAA